MKVETIFDFNIKIPLISLLCLCLYSTQIWGSEELLKQELTLVTTGQVTNIIDPLHIEIDNKKIIQLSALNVPDFTPYETGEYASTIKDYLDEFLEGKQVRIYQTKNTKKGRTNRMGHDMAHIVRKDDGVWIQGNLLEKGYARVQPSKTHIAMAIAMLSIENEARKNKTGLWSDTKYIPQDISLLKDTTNDWVLVEGTIRKVSMVKNRIYLNFGDDWRTDFTIGIPSDIRRKLSQNNVDPLSLSGKRVRARGWLEQYNGPYMELLSPEWLEQIERLHHNEKTANMPMQQNQTLKHSVVSGKNEKIKNNTDIQRNDNKDIE